MIYISFIRPQFMHYPEHRMCYHMRKYTYQVFLKSLDRRE